MRRDLIIGLIGSLVVHFGAYEFSQLNRKGPPPPPKRDEERVIDIQMPKIEPDEQQAEDDTVKPVPIEFAPPMQADVPQPTLDTAFVQPLQPPPPANVQIARMSVIVPQGGTGWRQGIKIFDESQLDQIPVPTFRPRPNYPFEMRRNGISGEVVVEFVVDTNGDVLNAFAFSSTNRAFEEDAVRGVMKWKFRPGRKDGHVVNSRMQIPIDFKLDSGDE